MIFFNQGMLLLGSNHFLISTIGTQVVARTASKFRPVWDSKPDLCNALYCNHRGKGSSSVEAFLTTNYVALITGNIID